MNCNLCSRDFERLEEHHLIPKCKRKQNYVKKNFKKSDLKVTIPLCKDCHSMLHEFFQEKELMRTLFTKDLILGNEKIQNYLKWIKKQKVREVII